MKFADKWIDLEIIILSEVTHNWNTNVTYFLSFVDDSFESLGICDSFGFP